jgi:DNA-binding NtrC family response regulator
LTFCCQSLHQPEIADSDIVVPELIERGQGRVLVVDDELSVLNFVCRSLELAGLFTVGMSDPAEALRIFIDNPFSFDCVITDMTMPASAAMNWPVESGIAALSCPSFSAAVSTSTSRIPKTL